MSIESKLFLVNNACQSSIVLSFGENHITAENLNRLGLKSVSLLSSEVFFSIYVELDGSVKLMPREGSPILIEFSNYKLNKRLTALSSVVAIDPNTCNFSVKNLNNTSFSFYLRDSEDWHSRLKNLISSLHEESKEICRICMDLMLRKCTLLPCNHVFCATCTDKWKSESSMCPACFRQFTEVVYCDNQRKKVRKRKFKYKERDDFEWYLNTAEACHICKSGENEGDMLVCDKCSFTVEHIGCVGLDKIPDGDWTCRVCSGKSRKKEKEGEGVVKRRYRTRSRPKEKKRLLRSGRRV